MSFSIHLCLLAGADNRYVCLRDTVRVSQSYFAAIHLVDTGSTDQTESLAQIGSVRYQRLSEWNDDWPLAFSHAVRDIPVGDWFLFLDSDERPSQHLLDHLAADLQSLDGEGLDAAYLPSMLHLAGRPVSIEAQDPALLLTSWPATHADYVRSPCWTKRNLIKRLPQTYLRANGAHCSFFQAQEHSRYLPRFYNHYKSEHAIAASTVLCSWSCLEAYSVPVDSPEWQRHNELRESTGLRNSGDFLQAAQAGNLPTAWLHFWETCEHSNLPTLVDYWKFAFQFRFSTKIEPSSCGRACCRYHGEQL